MVTILVIILQHIQISNHYSVHLKFTLGHLYLNKIGFNFLKKKLYNEPGNGPREDASSQ